MGTVMRRRLCLFLVAVGCVTAVSCFSKTTDLSRPQPAIMPDQPDSAHRAWHAAWVTHPTAPLREPLVLHFRRSLELAAVPISYKVRISADNRFILYVNGHRVGDGPARGDLSHWRYERFDLAPLLNAGH